MTASALAQQSACEWLLGHVPLNRSTTAITAVAANADFVAPTLQVQPDQPVLQLERLEWLNNLPVSLSRRFFPPGHRFEGQM